MSTWRILVGDVREKLAELPAGSVQTCVTSPPYFGLRDYGHAGQIGLEPTPAEYVAQLVDVFAGVWRVLRDDGTLWLNLGDSYASQGGPQVAQTKWQVEGASDGQNGGKSRTATVGLKPKDLVGIPWSVAFALRDAGWYLRSDIIWSKLNPMPESVTDRPTKAHEYLFLLAKSERYYYDAAAIVEPLSGTTLDRFGPLPQRTGQNGLDTVARSVGNGRAQTLGCGQDGSRNKRSVWTVATQPYPEAHFATYPEDLITPCILAGTSEKGQCPACGAPWERVVERESKQAAKAWTGSGRANGCVAGGGHHGRTGQWSASSTTTGWQPSCACNAGDPVPQLVLDPFTGSGTTGAVAIRHQRSFVGCELNPAYVELARRRIGNVAPMFAREDVA